MIDLESALGELPLVAILRGVRPEEVDAVADAIVVQGFRCIEVPLNSPDPFASIERLARRIGDEVLIGAGTVLDTAAVDRVAGAGGRLVVAPNLDPRVVERALGAGLACVPGVSLDQRDGNRLGLH